MPNSCSAGEDARIEHRPAEVHGGERHLRHAPAVRFVEHAVEQEIGATEEGAPRLRQEIEGRDVVEARLHRHLTAEARRDRDRLQHPGDGRQRADHEDVVGRGEARRLDEVAGRDQHRVERVDDSLGTRRGARGEDHHRRLVGVPARMMHRRMCWSPPARPAWHHRWCRSRATARRRRGRRGRTSEARARPAAASPPRCRAPAPTRRSWAPPSPAHRVAARRGWRRPTRGRCRRAGTPDRPARRRRRGARARRRRRRGRAARSSPHAPAPRPPPDVDHAAPRRGGGRPVPFPSGRRGASPAPARPHARRPPGQLVAGRHPQHSSGRRSLLQRRRRPRAPDADPESHVTVTRPWTALPRAGIPPYPPTVWALVEQAAEQWSDHVVLADDHGRSLTGRELRDAAATPRPRRPPRHRSGDGRLVAAPDHARDDGRDDRVGAASARCRTRSSRSCASARSGSSPTRSAPRCSSPRSAGAGSRTAIWRGRSRLEQGFTVVITDLDTDPTTIGNTLRLEPRRPATLWPPAVAREAAGALDLHSSGTTADPRACATPTGR